MESILWEWRHKVRKSPIPEEPHPTQASLHFWRAPRAEFRVRNWSEVEETVDWASPADDPVLSPRQTVERFDHHMPALRAGGLVAS